MELTPVSYLIVCPLVFLAGFVDSIGGGGGLISLPAYLLAGLPAHMAVATNKLSSSVGTSVAAGRFIRRGLVRLRLALPSVAAATVGASIGANLSLLIPEEAMKYILFAILPLSSFFVLNRHLFQDEGKHAAVADRKTVGICLISAFVIGMYDGFYGPGTGTFLIIAFTVFAKMTVNAANGKAKIINLTSNIASLAVYLANGQVLIPLGLAAAACNMAGNYLGSGLALEKGAKVVRPTILCVLALLLSKILFGW